MKISQLLKLLEHDELEVHMKHNGNNFQFEFYVDNNNIGIAMITKLADMTAVYQLQVLIVTPGFQRQGYGKKILKHIQKFVKEHHAKLCLDHDHILPDGEKFFGALKSSGMFHDFFDEI